MLDINKQEMKYSRQGEKVTIYDRDENGEIKYIEMDGERIPVVLRETTGYSEPVLFSANISNKLSEVLVKEFGIDDSSSYCQIVTDKGYLPIKAGDVIWKKSEVGRDDDGLVDNKTALCCQRCCRRGTDSRFVFVAKDCEVIWKRQSISTCLTKSPYKRL